MPHMDTIIRAYSPSTDTASLSDIWLQASILAHAFIGEDRLLEQQGLIESQYLPSAETWVACRGGRPVGFISLIDSFIGGLFVAPDQQGHGIGRALVAHALSLKGTLMLEVYTDNDQASNRGERRTIQACRSKTPRCFWRPKTIPAGRFAALPSPYRTPMYLCV